MRTFARSLAVAMLSLGAVMAIADSAVAQATGVAAVPEPFPDWAYPWDPDFKVTLATDTPQHLSGSAAAYSWVQARDLFVAADWHPENHAPMPPVVASGRKPDVRACGSCHRSEGTGGPENASLAGLPVDYFKQQIADYKSGVRKFSGPPRAAITLMLASVKAMTEAEAQAAADYFAALKPKKLIKVVESETVPKTMIARLYFIMRQGNENEPLGRRIIEIPDNAEQFELRDARATFTAFVPPGSIARGKELAKTGRSGTTIPCANCHGEDQKGVGPIPGIAGRSPSYLMRQLYDFKHGARAGPSAALMQPTVEKLALDDMIALAAYAASLEP